MTTAANRILVFPGQGSQHVGMAQDFYNIPALRELFEMTDEILKQNLTHLMLNGPEEELILTQNTQPALLLAGYVVTEYITSQSGKSPNEIATFIAGHSLGEYTAACIAGCFNLPTALKLVKARAQAMTTTIPANSGTMAAVLGTDIITVTNACISCGAFVANDNSNGQIVISGPIEAIEKTSTLLKKQGIKKIIKLNVSGPFHTLAMQPAANMVKEKLQNMEVTTPSLPLIMNTVAATVTDSANVCNNLINQITGTVRWRESMEHAANNNVEQVIEIGAGKVLSGLAKRCDKRLSSQSVNTIQAADDFIETLM